MRTFFVFAALCLLLSIPPSFAENSKDYFCSAMKEMSDKMNSEGPVWVDSATRQDGVAVICTTKIVEFKKFIKVSPAEFRPGWEQRKQDQWNAIYCEQGSEFRTAIDKGWNIASVLTFIDGKQYRLEAKCQ